MNENESPTTGNESKEKQETENTTKDISESREERISEINKELENFNHKATTEEDIGLIQNERNQEYQNQIADLEGELGIKLSNESTSMIHQNLVNNVTEGAHSDNETFNALNNEKKSLQLYNNLELGENAEEIIQNAKELIKTSDEDGSKLAIFEEALEYYSNEQEKLAETPVNHSTSSYSLACILERGILDGNLNKLSGEHADTGRIHSSKEKKDKKEKPKEKENSLSVPGYEQSDTVSLMYAKKNSRNPDLILDSQDITGKTIEEQIVNKVFSELPNLKPEEREIVTDVVEKIKNGRDMSDEDVMKEKMESVSKRTYYYDKNHVKGKINDIKAEIADLNKIIEKLEPEEDKKEIEDNQWEIKKKKGNLKVLEKRIENYKDEIPEMKKVIDNPFPVILTYEGNNIPQEDLDTIIPGLISERQTNTKLKNSEMRQIQVPKKNIEQVKAWVTKKLSQEETNNDEREALENIKIVPLEYLEAKNIINETK